MSMPLPPPALPLLNTSDSITQNGSESGHCSHFLLNGGIVPAKGLLKTKWSHHTATLWNPMNSMYCVIEWKYESMGKNLKQNDEEEWRSWQYWIFRVIKRFLKLSVERSCMIASWKAVMSANFKGKVDVKFNHEGHVWNQSPGFQGLGKHWQLHCWTQRWWRKVLF